MAAYIDVTISCKVWDAQALWDRAAAYMRDECNDSDAATTIGERDEPDVGACLIMLLDRSENLDGADIDESTTATSTPTPSRRPIWFASMAPATPLDALERRREIVSSPAEDVTIPPDSDIGPERFQSLAISLFHIVTAESETP